VAPPAHPQSLFNPIVFSTVQDNSHLEHSTRSSTSVPCHQSETVHQHCYAFVFLFLGSPKFGDESSWRELKGGFGEDDIADDRGPSKEIIPKLTRGCLH
jgi:hypothetical protein